MSAIDRNRAANERHGGCEGCRALRAEVAALRVRCETYREEREAERDLATARELLARVVENHDAQDPHFGGLDDAVIEPVRAFLDPRRDDPQCCDHLWGDRPSNWHADDCPRRDEARGPDLRALLARVAQELEPVASGRSSDPAYAEAAYKMIRDAGV